MADIFLNHVTLDYPIYGASSRSLRKHFLRASTGGLINQTDNAVMTVRALDDICLHIEHGDRVGILGHNGAGKSTLLRLLAGIYEPMMGEIRIQGKVTALLNVMLGLDPESTGYENIRICGILNGMSFKEIQRRTAEIAVFTDLGDYLHMPIRTYSSGMRLRLAFAIATAGHPEILILDEVVGAGDNQFMEKAKHRLNTLIDHSHIVILASHDEGIIHSLCNKILVLEAGRIKEFRANPILQHK
jgi:ABC-type polysaccharide/polyol phosphate transport system ATPase subunit